MLNREGRKGGITSRLMKAVIGSLNTGYKHVYSYALRESMGEKVC
jgi:hypothetical protein